MNMARRRARAIAIASAASVASSVAIGAAFGEPSSGEGEKAAKAVARASTSGRLPQTLVVIRRSRPAAAAPLQVSLPSGASVVPPAPPAPVPQPVTRSS